MNILMTQTQMFNLTYPFDVSLEGVQKVKERFVIKRHTQQKSMKSFEQCYKLS